MKKSTQLKIKDVFLKLVFVVFYLVFLNCKAQQIKTFDIKTFEKYKTRNEYHFVTPEQTSVIQREWQDEYEDIRKLKGSYMELYTSYYKSGAIKMQVKRFPKNFLAGIMKEYDKQGNLIKETDYDKPYKFTWKDVLALIKKREINMTDYKFRVRRGGDEKGAEWLITYNKSKKNMLGVIIIDGITGKIINEFERDYPGED